MGEDRFNVCAFNIPKLRRVLDVANGEAMVTYRHHMLGSRRQDVRGKSDTSLLKDKGNGIQRAALSFTNSKARTKYGDTSGSEPAAGNGDAELASPFLGSIAQAELGTSTLSEYALVQAAKSGDIAAFEELVKRHERQLMRLAERVTRNHEDAQEAVQDAFLQLFRKISQFQGNSKLSTWLYRVTVNEAYMKLRKQRRSVELIPLDVPKTQSLLNCVPDSAPNPEELLTATELWTDTIKAFRMLRPSLRLAFWLRAIKGLSVYQTARTLKLSVSAVKGRLYWGRLRIRERLAKQAKRKRGEWEFFSPSGRDSCGND